MILFLLDTMAQSGLRSFYPVRRRREDDTQSAATKRRKLTTANSHLEVSAEANDEILDTTDFSNVDGSRATAKKPTARSRRAAGGKGTARKSQSGRGKRCKKGDTTDVPNIKTLFEIINQTTTTTASVNSGVDAEAPPTASTSTDDKLSDECPLPQASGSTSKSNSVTSQSSQRNLQSRKATVTTPCPSPFKVPATPSVPVGTRSRTTTPKSSPAKTAAASSPAVSRSPTHSTTTASAVTSSPIAESRGARLLRMAKEKMVTKSPGSKVASPTTSDNSSSSVMAGRPTRMAARRKLLVANPDLPSTGSGSSKSVATASKFFPFSKEQERQEIAGELFKLSKKELAQPTRYESAKVKKRRAGASGSCSGGGGSEKKGREEGNGARTPKLKEFGAFEFVSPTKNEAAKTRYVVTLLVVLCVCCIT